MNVIPRREQQCRRSMYLSSHVVGAIEHELEHDLLNARHEHQGQRKVSPCVMLQCNKTTIRPAIVLRVLESARQTQELSRSKDVLQSRFRKACAQVRHALGFAVYKYFGLVHLVYFALLALLGSLCIWAAELINMSNEVSYIDALFSSASCVGTSGLMTVDYHLMTGFSKFVLGVLSVLGSPVFDSMAIMVTKYCLWTTPYVTQNLDATLKSGGRETLTDFKVVQFHAHIANRYEKSTLSVLIAAAVGYWVVVQGVVFVLLAIMLKSGGGGSGGKAFWGEAFVLTVSSFSGVGLSPFETSVRPFHRHPAVLSVLILSMALGNSLLPLGLRCTMWAVRKVALSKVRAGKSGWYKLERVATYILVFPRRLTIALLPKKETIYLCVTLFVIDVIAVCSVLAADSRLVVGDDWATRFVNALFEAVNTRNCGFSATSSSQISPCTMVMFCVLMYLGPIPNIVFMRSSRDRGEFDDETKRNDASDPRKAVGGGGSGSGSNDDDDQEYGPFKRELLNEGTEFHLKRLAFYDSVWIFVSWYLLCLIENENIKEDSSFDIFKFFFEVISAYSMVGLSLGYKYVTHGLAGTLQPLSKVVLIVVMIMGRHRFLPDNIDQAVLPACMPLDNARVSRTTLGDSLRALVAWIRKKRDGGFDDINEIGLDSVGIKSGSSSNFNEGNSMTEQKTRKKSALKKKGANNKKPKKSVRFNPTPEYFECDEEKQAKQTDPIPVEDGYDLTCSDESVNMY